jgi:very-short-patch-repair endonuclease
MSQYICDECVVLCSEIIAEHGGRPLPISSAKRSYGFDKLSDQITSLIEYGGCAGDSEIEKLMHAALSWGISLNVSGRFDSVHFALSDDVPKKFAEQFSGNRSVLIIQQQANIAKWRMDFLVHHWLDDWNRFVVECDGHDFHERTKDQAANDRSRDRAMAMMGLTVLRFTGSEIWNDPLGCARQVVEYAERARNTTTAMAAAA